MTAATYLQSSAPLAQAEANTRAIEGIYPAPGFHWVGDGFKVAGYFSAIPDAVRKLSPFLLLDYHPAHDYSPTARKRGVGVHPHRGFETVTLAWQGSVAHHDSTGAGGVIGPGRRAVDDGRFGHLAQGVSRGRATRSAAAHFRWRSSG